MNVLIVGNSEINQALEEQLIAEGLMAEVVPSCDDIVRFQGEPGAYVATTPRKVINAAGVIITEQPAIEDVTAGHAKARSLWDPLEDLGEIDNLEDQVVILLDYVSETPEYMTIKALELACRLREEKKRVVFLSMFVKTGAGEMERIYRRARQAGVTFIKYELLSLSADESGDCFTVKAFDGVFETVITTPYVFAAGAEDRSKFSKIIKKFRLAQSNHGFMGGNKFFLNPALTSRKGIYYYGPDLAQDTLSGSFAQVLPSIITEIDEIATKEPGDEYASIEAKKCAFCYSCYRACPHGALEPDLENDAMTCTRSACEACGTCAAICPGDAITMKSEIPGLRAETIGHMKTEKCKVFCCENSAWAALGEIAADLGGDFEKLDISKMPCGGRLGQDMLTNALAYYDKVLVAVCREDACRHMVGDRRACQNAQQITSVLSQMHSPEKKVGWLKTSHAMAQEFLEDIRQFLQD